MERVRSLVRSDRRLTLRIISSELNLNQFTVHQILTQDLDMRKVCAKMVPKNLTTGRRPIGGTCVLIFWTALRGSQNSSVTLSQVMNHGFWSTTPRQNAKVGSGTCKLFPSQESENEQIQNQIDAYLFFLTVRGSSARYLCHQDKLSIKLFIGKSLKDSGQGWHVCDQALHALGCCTTTTPHVTQQSPSMNF